VGEPGRDELDAPPSPARDLSKNVAGVGVSHEAARRRRRDGAPAARREAERARAMLTAALTTHSHTELATNLPVRSLIVVVSTVPQIAAEPPVPVVALQQLHYTVETMPGRLSDDHVKAVHEVAQSQDNWILPTTSR
jgi:hypothetical protein